MPPTIHPSPAARPAEHTVDVEEVPTQEEAAAEETDAAYETDATQATGQEPPSRTSSIFSTVTQTNTQLNATQSTVGPGEADPQRFPAQAAFEAWLPDEPDDIPRPDEAPEAFNEFYRTFVRYVSEPFFNKDIRDT